MASFGVMGIGGSGLPIEEIFEARIRGARILNKNGAFTITDDDTTYSNMVNASICIGSITGSYLKKTTAKKSGYYTFITSYPGGSGSFAPMVMDPVYVAAGGTIYDHTSYNVSACVIVYFGETNLFA